MSRGEQEWNCWSLAYIFGSKDQTANATQDQAELQKWK